MTWTNYVCFFLNNLVLFSSVATVLTSTQAHVLEFAVEPSDTIVEAGQSAVLDCVVRASHHQSSVLTQWLDQDGQKLTFIGDLYRSQLTNGSLYITSVIEEQRLTGTYQCMASLPNVGSIISRTAKLSIASLSGFQEEPRDITVFLGQKAYFACRAIANPPPKIKWLKDERPLQIDELRMTLLPSGALEIDEVVNSDQGTYRCNASGYSSYKLSNKASLMINGDQEQAAHATSPTFIAIPQSQTVVEGQNVSLDCSANGNPNPIITWLKDGLAIDMNFLDSRFSLVGSTNSLRITNIQEQDIGTYQCRAENREDSLDASALIQVQVPPKFLKKPQDKIDMQNTDTEFQCSVYGVPEPKIQWFKDGEAITYTEYYKIINGHNLKINGLMVSDSGLFQCFAFNPAGNIQAAASLKVISNSDQFLPTPTTVVAPKKKVHPKNRNKKLPNIHRSDDPLYKQSFSLFSSLKSESSSKLGEVDFGHLAVPRTNSQTNNQGVYDPHTAFNSLKSSETNDNFDNLGDVQSAFSPASQQPISVGTVEKITSGLPGPPQDLRAPVVKARFIVLSWNPPDVNAENIQAYSVYYREERSDRERFLNTSRSKMEEINIPGLQPGRVYNFRVVAITPHGLGVSSEILTITTQSEEHVASAPQQFNAFATSPRTIHISWTPPHTPNGQILRYTVYYMETATSVEHNVDTSELSYDLTGLLPYTEYSIWVVAVNTNGPGSSSDEKTVRTFTDTPSEPPSNITFEPSSTNIVVRWEPPPREAQNGVILGYKLRYRLQGKKGTTVQTEANKRHFVINDLERGVPYQIRLWAVNVNGTGVGSNWYDVSTFEHDLDESNVPEQPGSIKVRPTADRLYVLWTPPLNQNVRVRNYILGWGKGIPDQYTQDLDEKSRTYIIERLEPNSEYVLSLRASNILGAGPPIYTTVRTQDEPPPEPAQAIMPPMGLKAQVLSSSSVVLYWTDPTLSKSQYVRDNRYYVVSYADEKSSKKKHMNVTDLNIMIDDLKPNTRYRFSVKTVKGRKESKWSMETEINTWELPPNIAPRDVDVHLKDEESQQIELTWQPPKITTGRVTGYVILYTDDKTKSDPEWQALAIKGDNHSSVINNLRPFTLYYFKVQARNSRGYGPFSNIVTFRTGQNVALAVSGPNNESKGILSGQWPLYLILGGCLLAVSTIAVVIGFLCCRKRNQNTTPDRSKKGYQKGNQNIKPPDLWIHHDQMELKSMEKGHSNNDGASSSGAMTLPRSVGGNDYDNHENVHSNSLDKRSYVPSYAIATPINTASSDSTPSSKTSYPRTQYSMPRTHTAALEASSTPHSHTSDNLYSQHQQNNPSYDSNAPPTIGFLSQPPPPVAHIPPGSTYAPGMSVLSDAQAGKRVPGQGHPLKSFTVPAPPPISAPGTPQPKHIVTVRPSSSPFKKAPTSSSSTLTSTPPSRISASNPPPHTADELQRLHPSHSTEELNQEMANLEGLMLTLNEITANEFEC